MRYKLLIISYFISNFLFSQKNHLFLSLSTTHSFGFGSIENSLIKCKSIAAQKLGYSVGLGYEHSYHEDFKVRIQTNYAFVHFANLINSEDVTNLKIMSDYQLLEIPATFIVPINKKKNMYLGSGIGAAMNIKHRFFRNEIEGEFQNKFDSTSVFPKDFSIVPMTNILVGYTIPLKNKTFLHFEPFCILRYGRKTTLFSSYKKGMQFSYGISVYLAFSK